MSLMNEAFSQYLDKFIIVYLDDILIYSDTSDDHLDHIRKALNVLGKEKLYAKLSKYCFGAQEVDYLGFIIRPSGVAINLHKAQAIEQWPTPRSKKDVQSFLGLIKCYRRFIKDCSKISKRLTEFTMEVLFAWHSDAVNDFATLKKTVTTAPILQTFHDDYPVIVTTDASKKAIGAVLKQEGPNDCRTVAFTSRTLNMAEQNYAGHALELLETVDTLRAWRCYLHGRKFVVHTVYYPPRYLQRKSTCRREKYDGLSASSNSIFSIIPLRGKSEQVAVSLSRQSKDSPSTQ